MAYDLDALRRRRPEFFELKTSPDGTKMPYWIHVKSGDRFFFAGLRERWIDRDTDGMIESCRPSRSRRTRLWSPIHSRMPVEFIADAIDEWLSPDR